MKLKLLIIALSVAAAGAAQAATTSINLGTYQVTGSFALAPLGGLGLEASAVTYARDRGTNGTLFFVGDEGLGVVEITRTGQTIGSMAFTNWPAASTNNDAEGLTYLGSGVLVVTEERLQDAFKFTYQQGGGVALASAPFVSIGGPAGNLGTEGISYDASDGKFFTVKQNSPQDVLAGTLTFETTGGVSTMSQLFDPGLLALASLSDVQTLSPVDALAGTPGADNLLILSLDSRRLVEVTRTGVVVSSLDLTGITTQAIEGVTVDEKGLIYLIAEDSGTGNSRLIELTPVPEPGTWALMLAGLGIMGLAVRRRGQASPR
jgi:uncharacterized protein YjiK